MPGHATILMAEDDENDIILMRRAFSKARLANPVQVVRDGDEAVDYLAGNGRYADRAAYPFPGILLLDLKMPKRCGFEVMQWLQDESLRHELRVVVLTASNDEQDLAKAFELNADSYLVKPANFDELVALVGRLHGYWMILDGKPESLPLLIEA